MDRHARQVLLADVGPTGQRRIAGAIADVRSVGLAGEVAARYLAGAGVGLLRVREPALVAAAAEVDPSVRAELVAELAEGAPAPSPPGGFHDAAAGDVARGALEALALLRRALEGAT